MPADRNDARDCPTPGNSDWTTNMVPPSTAAPTPVAQRIQNLSHRRRRAGGGRNHFPTAVPAHRRIGRIADNDVNGQALNAWGNAQENVHVHRD